MRTITHVRRSGPVRSFCISAVRLVAGRRGSLRRSVAFCTSLWAVGATCGDSTAPPDPAVPTTLQAVTATQQQAEVGTAVAEPPAVLVRDQYNQAMVGVSVAFTVSVGAGSVAPSSASTGTDGIARATSWTLGNAAGNNVVIATVGGLAPVSFSATGMLPPPVATTVEAASAVVQQATVGTAVAAPPAVLVRDQRGEPMSDVQVTFAVSAGGGLIAPASAPTGPDGIARATSWTLGAAAGENTATATVAGLPVVTFTAAGTAAPPVATTVEAISATVQTAIVATTVADAPAVLVKDQNGEPLAGVSVAFSITAGGGDVQPPTALTESDGIARATAWTVGAAPGANAVTASVTGLAPVVFTATGVPLPAQNPHSIVAVTATSQVGLIGAPVADPPGVRVLDEDGEPIAGVTVSFAVTEGGGSVSPAEQITNADGVALTTSWTLGPATGSNTVAATVAGLPSVFFTATGNAPQLTATSLEAVTPQTQQAAVGTAVAVPPGVRVRDQFNAPLPGIPITFTVTTGNGTLLPSPSIVVSDANGVAAVTAWTLGPAAGANTVVATFGSLTAVVFNATGFVPAAPSVVSAVTATTQTGPAAGAAPDPPGVLVRDQNNNPLAGVSVTFAVTGGGGSVDPETQVTGPLGIARATSWTLGTMPGVNTLTATVSGLPIVTFTATGILAPTSVVATTTQAQQAPVGTTVASPPAVRVLDQFGNPMAGVAVTFAITAGGGSASPLNQATGPDGLAALASWTLGPVPGPNTITATVQGLAPVTFTAGGVQPTATATSIQATTPLVQEGAAGAAVPAPPGVLVRDQNDMPMPGVTVAFSITAGGGTTDPVGAVATGADGIARLTTWTLGTAPGTNTLTASVPGLAPVTFSATGALRATTVQATTATAQQAPAGSNVPEPPGVLVRDQNNNPLAGVTVAFAVTGGGGSRSPATVTTEADGTAELATWTLGPAAGPNTLTATVSGLAPVTFTAAGTQVVTSVQAGTPTMMQAPAGSAVSTPPGVIVRDHLNNPMQGVTVTFSVTGGGGSISPASVVTGVDGTAQLTSWTLGTAPGSNTVTATVAGLTPVTFNALGSLVITAIEATTPTSQQVAAGSAVTTPPGVVVRDQFGAGMSGVTVTFAVTAGGGSIAPASVVTGASGTAQLTNWTLGPAAGTNTVTATAGSLAPVTFNATGVVAGPPATVTAVTATEQSAPANSPVPQPPGVIVRDAASLPVGGVTVTFAVTSGGGSIVPTTVVTGADGIAQVTSWTLGNAATQTASATVSGLPPVVFTATRSATALVPTTIEAVTPVSQDTLAGSPVPSPPGVRVRNQFGELMPGVSVSFTITAGGGTRSPASVTTNSQGIAQLTSWTLGPGAGTNTLKAAASGLADSVTFNATATLRATSIQAGTPTMMQAPAGSAVSTPPGVIVRDHLNNPMQGVTVTFSVTGGGGSISPASVVTGVDGTAQLTSWTLGTAPGSNTVTATVAGLTPVTFNALGSLVITAIEATTPTSQQVAAGSAVTTPPGVVVRDQFGAGMSGVTVTFAVTAGGGSIAPASVVTGASGTAQLTNWTLGPAAGTNTVTATAGSLAPVTFNATGALVAATIQATSPTTQQAPAGQPVASPPSVMVRDQNDTPLAGVTVTFAVTGGGGSVTPASAVTGPDGTATATEWRLGAAQGGNTLTAAVGDLTPVTFTATGILLPSTVQAVTATSQTTSAGGAVSEPPGVIVRDQNGQPMQGITVSFAVTAGGGSISPASQSTGADGIARLTTWTVGSSAGANTVTATVSGLTPVTFSATATLVATSVQAQSPTSQQGPTGTPVAQPPAVLVRDQLNNPMQGVTVSFAVTGGGGSVAPSSVVTGANGIAQLTSWTLGVTPGANTVTATVTGLTPVTFSATGVQVVTSITATTAISQEAPSGGPVPQPPGVVVRDHRGDPMQGVAVSFVVTGGGGSVTPGVVVTGANGTAQVSSWTLGSGAGANSLTASVAGLAPVVFTATGVVTPTSVLSVTPQSQQAPAGSPVPQPPGVIVRDQLGNPMAGVSVAFAVTSGGGSRTPPTVTTGADGVARVTTWTLGAAPGANTLTATVTGLPVVTFTATGVLVPGSIQAVTPTSQAAPAGTLVSQPPSVRVRDQANNLLQGATVTFAVTSGAGSIIPSSQATGADGIASLSSWRLGIAPGPNTVTATASGLAPVVFTATGTSVVTSVNPITAVSQLVPAATNAPQAPAVVVRDHNNNPVQGVTVSFAVSGGGGSVSPASASTNAMGVAQVSSWTVGTSGSSSMTATVSGLAPVTFTATILVPGSGSLQPVAPSVQSARVGTAVSQPPAVLVRDQNSNPLPGVPVAFAVTGGGGSISPSTPVTGSDGVARLTSWTLGASPGTNSVSATVSGLPSLNFTATGLAPGSVQAVTALVQQGTFGAAVAQPPGVVVRDQNGAPMQGVSVAFAITGGGGTRTPASVNTGANGVAQLTSWVLGAAPGTNTLTATVSGLTPVTFTAIGGASAATVQAASAVAQSAPASTVVSDLPAVLVRDQSGNPLQGVAVSFAVTAGGGFVTPSVVATGSDGIARVSAWQMGNAGGTNTLVATVPGLPSVTFNATALVPATLQAVTATSLSAPVNGLVTELPAVIARDGSNQPMAGVRVIFELVSEGGFITPTIRFTGADGIAQASAWQLGPQPGPNIVEAFVTGLPSVVFTATGIAPPATPASIQAVTPTTQSALAGTNVTDPPGVIVRNASAEPIEGVAVAFTITAGGGTRAPASVLTGADGIARLTSWTLGTIGGTNTLTASVAGLAPVTFNATATSPPPATPTTMGAGTATNQQAPAGAAVSQPPGVFVRDQNGLSLPGVTVNFAVTSGGGSVTPASVVTNAGGFALLTTWTLGPSPGLNTVAATVAGLPPVTFAATGIRVPSSVHAVTPIVQEAVVFTSVPTPPGILVRDQNGNPMPGVTVNFAVTGGGGALAPGSQITGSDGIARVNTWTLGQTPGPNTATGSVLNVGSVTFNATGIAANSTQAITAVSQEAAAGSVVPAPPGVLVRDQNGNPMPGVPVTFTPTSAGASVNPGTVVTGADGTARLTSWTLSSTPGANSVSAAAPGTAPVSFTATGILVPGTIQATTTTSQQAPAGSNVATPPAVVVRDQNNNPLAGAVVTFTVTAGNGAVSPATVTTNASGSASLTSWTLGPAAGTNTVTARVGNLAPLTFSATGLWVPTSIEAASVTTQQAPIGTNVPVPPSVRVRDQNSNPLPGVAVVFTITGGGGSPASAAHLTGHDGVAHAARWTVGPTQGVNTMSAAVAGFDPITFTAFGMTPTTMVAVSPTAQTAPAGGAPGAMPAVLVRDQNGDPLPGVTVTFAIVQGGGLLLPNPPAVITGADGVARLASWVVGTTPGLNVVTATVPGLQAVTFTAEGIAGECPEPASITLGVTTGGQLGSTGCRLTSGEFVEFYSFTIAQQRTVRVFMGAAAFDPYVLLLKENGQPVAENDDRNPGIDFNSELHAVLAPGTYVLAASSAIVGASGPFTIRVEETSQPVTNAIPFFTTRGITTDQSLSSTDYNDANKWTDFYVLFLQAGETVTIQMNSSAVNSYLLFLAADGLIEDDNSGGGQNARIVYTSPTARFYLFAATSSGGGQTGAYTLSVQ